MIVKFNYKVDEIKNDNLVTGLECKTTHFDLVAFFSWFKDKKLISNIINSSDFSFNVEKIYFTNLSLKHNGNYQCSIYLKNGRQEYETLETNVSSN